MTDLSAKHFHDEVSAVKWIEASRWPNGEVVCPLCGSLNVSRMAGKTQAGMFLCNDCRDKFTCRTGTVMERSHIPLHKWLLAIHLMATSKKGMSALQLMRNLDLGSYRTAWFLAHRVREAMADLEPNKTGGPLGGADKVVEADETVVGGKAKNRAYRDPAPKKMVATLVERGGRVRSKHVANIDSKTLRPFVMKNVSRKSTLNTDEASYYVKMGREFAKHHAVDHSRNEYAYKLDGITVTVNGPENYFSIFKRGVYGIYHSISEAHLHRYLAEFDFRYNNRSKLGVEDDERASKALKGIEGKRLTYHQPRQYAAAH
jgi:transposase-like protein